MFCVILQNLSKFVTSVHTHPYGKELPTGEFLVIGGRDGQCIATKEQLSVNRTEDSTTIVKYLTVHTLDILDN